MSEQDIIQVAAFFDSPAGKKYVAGHAGLSSEALPTSPEPGAKSCRPTSLSARAPGDEEEGRRFLAGRVSSRAGDGEVNDGVRRRFLRDRRRVGRRARGAHRRRPWRKDAGRRGKPYRRHVRHPRLRAEEALCSRQPLRRRLPRRGRVSAGALASRPFDWPTLVAAKEKEISRLSDAYRENLARVRRQAHRTAGDRRRPPPGAASPTAARSPPAIS